MGAEGSSQGRSSDGFLLLAHLRSRHVTTTSETNSLPTEQLEPAAAAVKALVVVAPEVAAPSKRRKSLLALALCALAINGTAALVTLPSAGSLELPNVSSLAELLSGWKGSTLLSDWKEPTPKPDPVVVALKDVQSAQQQQAASLRENDYSLQQNTVLLQQDSMVLISLRQSITDERVDVKKISLQLSTLIAKVDALQNAMTSDLTSSIPRGHARNLLSMRKQMARRTKPAGPVSVGGAPLSLSPAATSAPKG
jgi:hypothetical protein